MKIVLSAAVVLAAVGIAPSLVSAQNITVTPSNNYGWSSSTYGPDYTGPYANAFSGITTSHPRSGMGSAEITLADEGISEADWSYGFAAPQGLSGLTSLSFDWYVNSTSTTPAWTTPAMSLLLSNGKSLVWEGAYNGTEPTAPQDIWVSSNILSGNFWYTGNTENCTGIVPFDQSLSAFNDQCFNGDAQVVGLDAFLGYGYTGTYFNGAVDNIAYAFNDADATTFNFEPDGPNGAVPEPATLSLMATGLVGLAGAARRRKRNK